MQLREVGDDEARGGSEQREEPTVSFSEFFYSSSYCDFVFFTFIVICFLVLSCGYYNEYGIESFVVVLLFLMMCCCFLCLLL